MHRVDVVERPFVAQPAEFANPANPANPAEVAGSSEVGEGVEGQVIFAVQVLASGSLADYLQVASSDEGLDAAALRTLLATRFAPAQVATEPIDMHVAVALNFKDSTMITMDVEDLWVPNERTGRSPATTLQVFQRDELDRTPRLIRDVRPLGASREGSATVQFFIDREGQVRMPMVTKADDAGMANSALQAVRQWHFLPAYRHGQAVIALVRQRFDFHAP